jgi:hypothetical protein
MAKNQDELGPKISQVSHGANSPNIVGDNNRLFLGSTSRTLSQAQGQRVATAVSRIPKGKIVVTAYMSAEDGQDYGAYVASAIVAGGWSVEGNRINRAVGTVADQIRGLALLVRDATAPPRVALQLSEALASEGLAAPLATDPALPEETILLWIGRR